MVYIFYFLYFPFLLIIFKDYFIFIMCMFVCLCVGLFIWLKVDATAKRGPSIPCTWSYRCELPDLAAGK